MKPIDQEIYDLQRRKEMLNAYERLSINPDFQKVIMDYHQRQHALDLVKQMGQHPIDETTTQSITRQLEAVALFGTYLENLSFELPDIDLKIQEALTRREELTRNT